jgi:hypothetical protein
MFSSARKRWVVYRGIITSGTWSLTLRTLSKALGSQWMLN